MLGGRGLVFMRGELNFVMIRVLFDGCVCGIVLQKYVNYY